MGGVDHTLATKCLDLCQALISQGQAFTAWHGTVTSYTISLDTRSKEIPSLTARKKTSPSILRRNERRREEFLKRKTETIPEAVETMAVKPKVQGSWSSELVGGSKAVKVKLKKKPLNDIPQVDGNIEECSSDAEVHTNEKPATKDASVRVDKLEFTPSTELKEIYERVFHSSFPT